MAAMPDKAPSFYFVDIQSDDIERFDAFVRERAPGGTLERVPMLRGRIAAVDGVKAEELKPEQSASWVLRSDRGITYANDLPAGSRLAEGEWWGPDYKGPPLVSLEKKIADGLGLRIGEPITVNVLGRNITATVANLRSVDWQNLGINFVLVFSPGTFAGAPHTHIGTLTYPPGKHSTDAETAPIRDVAGAFPSVTTVRVKDALDAVGSVATNLVMAVRGASIVALVSAVLVLGGALAAGHRHRVYDAVVMKTLGATRGKLIGAYALEYLLLGGATALFGVAAGSVAAWLVVTNVMNLSFTWLLAPALSAAFGALVVTVAFGLIGTFTALSHKPAPVLRNL
jgi:putative ABC transport system permease protein